MRYVEICTCHVLLMSFCAFVGPFGCSGTKTVTKNVSSGVPWPVGGGVGWDSVFFQKSKKKIVAHSIGNCLKRAQMTLKVARSEQKVPKSAFFCSMVPSQGLPGGLGLSFFQKSRKKNSCSFDRKLSETCSNDIKNGQK